MKKTGSIVLKMVFIGVVVLVLVIADVIIGAKVKERDAYRQQAVSSIYDAAGGSFVIKNVELIVPYVHHVRKTNSNGHKYVENENGEYSIQTKTLNVNADVVSEIRNVGIYKAPVYSGKVKIDGEFLCNLKNDTDYTYNFKKARIGIVLKDSSLIEIPVYTINGVTKETEFGSDYVVIEENTDKYRVSRVPSLNSEFACVEGTNTFSTELNIRGANSFRVYVNGNQTRVNVKSDWPSPGFTSYDYLPVKREISDNGFTAEWFVPFSAGDGEKIIGFEYKQPVEVYKMLNRAVTYGFLFIIVPFIVLFLYELFMNSSTCSFALPMYFSGFKISSISSSFRSNAGSSLIRFNKSLGNPNSFTCLPASIECSLILSCNSCLSPPFFTASIIIFSEAINGNSSFICFSITFGYTTISEIMFK